MAYPILLPSYKLHMLLMPNRPVPRGGEADRRPVATPPVPALPALPMAPRLDAQPGQGCEQP